MDFNNAKKGRTAAFHNLGCKVNSYEMDGMLQSLRENGYTIVDFDEVADVYIVNTCTVTNIADRKSRQMLHKAKKTNPQAVVVAVGCYVQSDTQAVSSDDAVDILIGNNRKKDLVYILEDYLRGIEHDNVIDINHTHEYEELQLASTNEHTRAYIKIQDGCNQFCTYCMIPYVRGRVRSRKKEDILSEIRTLVKNGYKEFVLTGIHISSYGMDSGNYDLTGLNGSTDLIGLIGLIDLIEEIDNIEGVERIRLGSLEPRVVTDEFASRIAALKHICPHFHLSLQSGCDDTLKRMNRHYTTDEFKRSVKALRAVFEHPAITTDIIAGFPGETDLEFERTREFVEGIKFYETHIFKYSRRKGTKAADMPGQLTEKVKAKRSGLLQEIEAKASREYRSFYIKKEVQVLIEEPKMINGREYYIGHTREYVKCAIEKAAAQRLLCPGESAENMLVTGTVKGFLEPEIMELEI